MEPTSERRFDANVVAQILLEIAHEQSLAKLLRKLVDRVMDRPHMVCAQVWLIEKGDLCATCPRRPECPDQSRCLHLAAAKGKSLAGPGKGFGRLDPETAREPLGVAPFGNVVISGQQRAVPDLNKQPISPLDPDWMREEGISGYAINPISYKGEALGAIVSATREPFQEELRPWGSILANHIGAAIANARAFEEIRVAGERLEQANQNLERELAERKEAEQQVALLSLALDNVREAAFLIDERARFYYVNEEACRLLGYSRAELLGMGVADIDHESPTEGWSDHWRELKARRSLTFESRHRTQDGRTFPVEISANYFEYGGRAYNLALARDITERKRAEEALRRSEAYLAEGQRLSHTGSWAWSPVTLETLFWSEEMFRIYGLNPREGVPTAEAFWQRIHPEDLGRARELLMKAAQRSMEYAHDHRIVLPDGTVKHIHAIGHPVLDENGQLAQYVGTAMDVTERKRAEDELRNLNQSLRESERKYRELVENANSIILHWGRDGRVIFLNEFGQRFFGYTEAEIRGRHVVGTIVPESESDGRSLRRLIDEIGANPVAFEQHINENVRRNGERVWIAWTNKMVLDAQGQLAEILSIGADITARKRMEEELRLMHFSLEHASDAVYGMDPQGRIVFVNESACRSLNRSRAEVLSLSIPDINPVFSAELWRSTWQQLKAQGSITLETHHRTKDGRVFPVEVTSNYLDFGGKEYAFAFVRDISERKRAEEALRRAAGYLAETQRLTHTGTFVCDETTKPLYWSEEMFRIFGFDPQHGLPTRDEPPQRIHPEDLGQFWQAFQRGIHEKVDCEVEYRIVLPDGTVKHVNGIGHPVLNANGELVEYVGTVVDITERKRTEEELRKHRENLEDMVRHRTEQLAEAKARAEAANREKSAFLANMSHELRTPLNAVLGFSRLLKSGLDVTPHQKEALDIIVRSGEHLLNLINNVLDMAKIESGRVVLEESEVDLHQLMHEIQSLMGVGAAEKGLQFTLERAPDLPRFVAVDAGKLRQVLLNLVGNAIKYTDSGGVKLHARLASRERTEKAQIRFEVEDSGPGISQQDCQRIFLPFVQGSQTSAQAGTGLGLAICKQYVELMGGQIGIASEPGKGSVFYFSIPVSVLPSVAEAEEPKHGRILGLAEGQPRHRLLIVEDQAENRLLLRRLLDPLGFELSEAVNGKEAVALFEHWRPDLIWMDIRMPVMDGLEAVRRIRATQAGADTKIIALTAHALEEEKSAIMAAGCDDFVRKPFREQEIFDALARHLRLKFIHEKAPGPEITPEAPGLALHPEQLNGLPAELLRDLRQAVIELDTARTQALIEQVTERDASLGRALNTLATRLGYRKLLKLLERVHAQSGQTL